MKNEYKDPKISCVIPSKTPFLLSPGYQSLFFPFREDENEGIHYNTPPSISGTSMRLPRASRLIIYETKKQMLEITSFQSIRQILGVAEF